MAKIIKKALNPEAVNSFSFSIIFSVSLDQYEQIVWHMNKLNDELVGYFRSIIFLSEHGEVRLC